MFCFRNIDGQQRPVTFLWLYLILVLPGRNLIHQMLTSAEVPHFLQCPESILRHIYIAKGLQSFYSFIHSLIHSGDLYSVLSRYYYSEALTAESRQKKKDLREM